MYIIYMIRRKNELFKFALNRKIPLEYSNDFRMKIQNKKSSLFNFFSRYPFDPLTRWRYISFRAEPRENISLTSCRNSSSSEHPFIWKQNALIITKMVESYSNKDLPEHSQVQWPVVGPSTDILLNYSIPNSTFRCTVPVGCFLRYSVFLSVMYISAYLIVLVVGIIGNVCAFAVVWRDRSLHSVYYRFMANLAIADLLVLLFCLPVTLLGNLYGRKYFYRVLAWFNTWRTLESEISFKA